jgi:hypothetical protein
MEQIAAFSRLRPTRGCAEGIWSDIMEKKIAGLLGAVAALSTMTAAQAAPTSVPTTDPLQANSYSDLLEPIPNAAAVLKVVDEREPATADASIQLAQYHHHHHHHHHSHWRRGPVVVIGRHRHHHHHHHHHHFRRDY